MCENPSQIICKFFLKKFVFFSAENIILMALLYMSLRKSSWFQSSSNQLILLIKAMCLANTTKFFLLPIVIWRAQQSDFVIQLNFMIVIGYFVYGLVNVHSGWFFLRCEKMKIESKNSLLVCVTNFVL